MVIDIIGLIGFAIFTIRIGSSFLSIFKGFDISIPIITKITPWCPYIFIIAALILILKERSKKKLTTFLINIVVFIILLFFVYPFLVVGYFLPLYQISNITQ